ncbi:MAG: hypothetical protein ACI9QC_000907, partial [Oceanicoccus sp.]
AIMSLVDQGILEGYGDGTFKADQEVTRAETLKIVLLGSGLEVAEASELHFSDVSEGDWHVDYVEAAYNAGLVEGYADGTYLPNQTVTRAEAVKIVLSSADLEYETVDSEDWFAPYETYAKDWNIEPNQTDGLWHPYDEMTRGNLSEMMYRLQEVLANGSAYDETSSWEAVEFPTVDVTLKVPQTWYTKAEGVGAAWLLDEENNQYSLLTPYDNGGTLLMTRYSNSEGESAATLFANIETQTEATTVQTTINGYDTLIIHIDDELYFREWYVYLENNRLVHFVAMRGQGDYSDELEYYLNEMVESVAYLSTGDTGLTTDEIVEELRASISADGLGMEMIELLSDPELIETDTIGIGTGPVDYYYSPSANITIKYERSFDVILDIEDGQTTAF